MPRGDAAGLRRPRLLGRSLSALPFARSARSLCYGLWAHDWTTIVASVGVAVIWPLIENDVRMRQQRTLLDRLWDDTDLSDSA